MLKKATGESVIGVEEQEIFCNRINTAYAMARALSGYASGLTDASMGELSILALAIDGIANELETAMDDYEEALL